MFCVKRVTDARLEVSVDEESDHLANGWRSAGLWCRNGCLGKNCLNVLSSIFFSGLQPAICSDFGTSDKEMHNFHCVVRVNPVFLV